MRSSFVSALNQAFYLTFVASFAGQVNNHLLLEVAGTLWVSDGTSGGTHILDDGEAGSSLSNASATVTANGKAYFTADDGVHGVQFWQTDGTATTMVSSSIVGNVQGPLSLNGHLVFVSGSSLETWDGASGSATVLMAGQINLGNALYFVQDGQLYFNSWNDGGAGLFVSDGSVAGAREIASGSYSAVAAVGGHYVLAGSGGDGLYVSDGSGGATLAKSGNVQLPREGRLSRLLHPERRPVVGHRRHACAGPSSLKMG